LDQSWVVTGASRGIGLAIAAEAISAGHRVACVARGADVDAAAARLGGRALAARANMTDAAQVEVAIGEAAERLGGIDVLVNNAGIHRGGRVTRISEADWNAVLRTNIDGAFHAARAALPYMKPGGAIINIGAVIGLRGFAGDTAYAASKAGLIGFTYALAMELAPRDIRVNLVIPGFTPTDMTAAVSDAARATIVAGIPLGRVCEPDEVAKVVLAVAGFTYMTGAVIPVDGGLLASL